MPSIDLSKKLGRVIRRRRKKLGLSQEELAHQAGITRNYVSLLELGQRNPTLNVIALLARALDTTVTVLVREVEAGR